MTMDSRPKPDLVEAWQGIQARLSEMRPSRRQGTSRSFAEYAWDTFDPREVVTILAAPGDSYFAHKDILYEGFCAWVADPSDVTLPKRAMVLRTALHLDAAEKAGRDLYRGAGRLGDVLIRTHLVDPEFFEEIYYPIGGILRIAKSLSRAGYRSKLAECAKSTDCAVKIVEIYHYHVDNLLPQEIYGKPSLNSAAPILESVYIYEPELPGERSVKEYWRRKKDAAAFAYAAKSIELIEGQTLLDAILSGKTTWRYHERIFMQWLSRARYVALEILSKCAETQTSQDALGILPDFTCKSFSPPAFDDVQKGVIVEKFSRKKTKAQT
ncbi:hypothetical protein [Methylobacterium sp. E-066]|uniref:hypothetical protein n=1 Tax=Methylobacterium sp. E-066 TaxID=2836584 RepID=UPI001FB95B67|nr:hypothetical protein [Methylobacterium sp. E-066]MCJ2144722.1 hypothetical protein [Methylobacterium sp. E-066]